MAQDSCELRPLERTYRERRPSVIKVIAIMCRFEFKNWSFFRIGFFMHIVSIFVGVATYFFLGKMIDSQGSSLYGENYISFLIVGYFLHSYLMASLTTYYSSISGAYWGAKLERLMLSSTPLSYYMISRAIFNFTINTVTGIAYVLMGMLLGVRINMTLSTIFSLFILLILSVLATSGLGLLSASMFTLLEAKAGGDPVNWIATQIGTFVGGLYYPVSMLPTWLQAISSIFPHTYSYDAARRLLLSNPSTSTLPLHNVFLGIDPLMGDIFGLTICTLLFLPLGIRLFQFSLEFARKDGSLSRWV